MKKLTAIVLLSIHFLNTSGYLAVFPFLQQKISVQTVDRLDKGIYRDDELVEVRMPFHSPYTLELEYQRVDGEIEMDGIHYSYVKRKIYNDTLYMLCIPNLEMTKLAEMRNGCLENIADITDPSSDKNSPLANTSLKKAVGADYHPFVQGYDLTLDRSLSVCVHPSVAVPVPIRYLPVPFQPPKA